MRFFIGIFFLSLTFPAQADELIQFTDGTTGWLNSQGYIWGKTQPPPHPIHHHGQYEHNNNPLPSAFGEDGTYYIPAGPNQLMDARRGHLVPIQ